jgi:hypothetical protein
VTIISENLGFFLAMLQLAVILAFTFVAERRRW